MKDEKIQIDDVKKQFIQIARQIYQNGLTPGKSGNISLKIPYKDDFKVIITPSGVSLKDISLNNIITVDSDGNMLDGDGEPSSEVFMHLEIYKKRDNIGGIVHTHSPYATGFSFSDEKIPRLEGFGKIDKPYLKTIDYATPGSAKLVKTASLGLKEEDVIILKNHGVIAVGSDLDEATLLAEFTESSAKTSFIACQLRRKKD